MFLLFQGSERHWSSTAVAALQACGLFGVEEDQVGYSCTLGIANIHVRSEFTETNEYCPACCRDGVGGRLKVIVSGGSSLPLHIEHFFDMAGLRVSEQVLAYPHHTLFVPNEWTIGRIGQLYVIRFWRDTD